MPRHSRSLIDAIRTHLGSHPRRIAEVGVYEAENAVELIRAFPSTTVYLIDPWESIAGQPEHPFADSRFAKLSHEDINFIREKACRRVLDAWLKQPHGCGEQYMPRIIPLADERIPETWYNAWAESFDAVFIDSHHDYDNVAAAANLWRPMVAEGGMLAFHDYNSPKYAGCTQAIDDFAAACNTKVHTAAGRLAYLLL